jgi:HSP20 family molecular chaperone IbpA
LSRAALDRRLFVRKFARTEETTRNMAMMIRRDEELEVSVVGRRLIISGKREATRDERDERFMRTFTLPDGADVDRIDAGVEDGVLRVSILVRADETSKLTIEERVKPALES